MRFVTVPKIPRPRIGGGNNDSVRGSLALVLMVCCAVAAMSWGLVPGAVTLAATAAATAAGEGASRKKGDSTPVIVDVLDSTSGRQF